MGWKSHLEGIVTNRHCPGGCEGVHIPYVLHHRYIRGRQTIQLPYWIGSLGSNREKVKRCKRHANYHHVCLSAGGLLSYAHIECGKGQASIKGVEV